MCRGRQARRRAAGLGASSCPKRGTHDTNLTEKALQEWQFSHCGVMRGSAVGATVLAGPACL